MLYYTIAEWWKNISCDCPSKTCINFFYFWIFRFNMECNLSLEYHVVKQLSTNERSILVQHIFAFMGKFLSGQNLTFIITKLYLLVFHPKYLCVEVSHIFKGRWVCNWVHQHEAVPFPHVLLPHCTELLLTSSVQYWNIEQRSRSLKVIKYKTVLGFDRWR